MSTFTEASPPESLASCRSAKFMRINHNSDMVTFSTEKVKNAIVKTSNHFFAVYVNAAY